MIAILLWYLIATLAGLAAFPLAYSLLGGLPDRGYAFARSLGLLLWGYIFWLLGSLGVLRNDLGGQLFALVILLSLSALSLQRVDLARLRAWVQSQRGYIIWVELLFLVAFAAWAIVRSANPDTFGTEKPMEVAFINAILRSETFPPHDPWLSGYAISYYYFGYVLVAMLARLSAVSGSVAFNLGLALVFALTALGSFGLVYNLLAARWVGSARKADPDQGAVPSQTGDAVHRESAENIGDDKDLPRPNPVLALFGPLFILIVSNIEGFLEVLHARGLFWKADLGGGATSRFWTWLDIADLTTPPSQQLSWLPRLYGTGNWWWWRASRVVQDYNFRSDAVQIIDEFPFFSYLLGDLHPHVLAMPFAFLAMVLTLNLFLGGGRGRTGVPRIGISWNISPAAFILAALVLGGMAFLNTWDWPIYVAFFAGAYVLQIARRSGWGWQRLVDFAGLGLALGFSGLLLYLPFFLGFSSQAGGLLPSLVFLTRGSHLWVMFAPLLVPLFVLLAFLWREYGEIRWLKRGLVLTGIVLGLFTLLELLLVLAISNLPIFTSLNPLAATAEQLFLNNLGAPDWGSLLRESLFRRLLYPGGWLTLLLLLIPCIALLSKPLKVRAGDNLDIVSGGVVADVPTSRYLPGPHLFTLLMVLSGALLVLAPEFFYLRDQFGSRMNTIFKFYFQAWLFWGIAAAYGMAILLKGLRGFRGGGFRLVTMLVLSMALFYPLLSLWDKTQGFNPPHGLTLDGAAYIAHSAPQELAAIEWLRSAPLGVIVEAVRQDGGQYSDYGRVAAHTGMPTVLGWIGHQIQWRGGAEEIGSRQADIERLYTTRSWEEANQVIRQYNIRYVIVGPRERSTYRVFEAKFDRLLVPVFSQGDMVIYEAARWDSK
jgi:YYY domain-containing protein